MTAKSMFRTPMMAFAAWLIVGGTLNAAQGVPDGSRFDVTADQNTAIVGSWLETVSVSGGPTFKSLVTYTADGARVSSDQGSVITEPPFPHVFSAGHGPWVHKRGRTFTTTFVQLISDLNGNLLFENRVHQTVTLNRSTDTYRAVWVAEFVDPAGSVVAVFEGTGEARRITTEPHTSRPEGQ